jgi:hypothetical protein
MPRKHIDAGRYNKEVLRALEEAGILYAQKGEVYDTVLYPWEKMPFGLTSFVDMIFIKAARLVSALATSQEKRETTAPAYAIDVTRDTLFDLIVYAAMALAYDELTSDRPRGERVE